MRWDVFHDVVNAAIAGAAAAACFGLPWTAAFALAVINVCLTLSRH